MKPHAKPGTGSGFTLTDLMVAVAVLSLLAALVVARLTAANEKAGVAVCMDNLGKVNRAVLQFGAENSERLPNASPGDQRPLWWWYKEQVKQHLGLKAESSAQDVVFGCPRDRGYSDRIPFRLNSRFDFSSYVFNGVTMPGMPNIAGLQLTAIGQPRKTLLVMEWTAHAPLSWHKSRTGQKNMPFYCDALSLVGFVDGHVALSKIYYDGYNAAYTRDPIAGYDYQYSAR